MEQNDYRLLIVLAIWDLVWKAIAMWKSARANQKYWFILLLFINTVGILPIGYLLYMRYLDSKQKPSVKILSPEKRIKSSKKK